MITEEVFCKEKGDFVDVTVTQQPGESPDELLQRFLREREQVLADCEV